MKLVKTSLLSSISTIVQILSAFIANKILAIYIGPSGMALTGNLQNFIQITLKFSNASVTTGVTKNIAEFYDNEEVRKKIISTAFTISICFSLFFSFILFRFKESLSIYFLHNIDYANVFCVFSITLIFFSLNSLFIAILNGFKEIKKYVIVTILSSITGLLLTVLLSIYLSINGALLSLVLSQTVVSFLTFFFIYKSPWFKMDYFFAGIDKASVVKLTKFSFMTLTAALTTPVSQMFIRTYAGNHLSWNQAGYWQCVTKVSDLYIMLLTTSLTVYFLPRFSEIKNSIDLRKEILTGYKIIIPIAVIIASVIFLFKKTIILALFSSDFLKMEDLFLFQMIGSVFQISSWVLGTLMVAKAMVKWHFISQVFFSLLFVLLAIFFMHLYGIRGVTIAYAINYTLHLIFMLFVFRKTLWN